MTTACMCTWESGCNGLGIVHCRGCGGDQCICTCGGERECLGCDACDDITPTEDLVVEHPEKGP